MSNKQQTYGIIIDTLLSVSIAAVLYTVVSTSRDLANGIVSSKYFWFYASMALLSVLAIPAAIIKRRERISFKLPDLLLLLFCLAAVLITLHHTGRLTNKCLLLIFAMLFYFYLRIFLSGKSKLLYVLCSLAFVVTGLIEAVWGLRQLYGFTSSQHNLFKITGSFFNPGPYSGWLAMVFPMAFWYVAPVFFDKNIPKGEIVFDFRKMTAIQKRFDSQGVKTQGFSPPQSGGSTIPSYRIKTPRKPFSYMLPPIFIKKLSTNV